MRRCNRFASLQSLSFPVIDNNLINFGNSYCVVFCSNYCGIIYRPTINHVYVLWYFVPISPSAAIGLRKSIQYFNRNMRMQHTRNVMPSRPCVLPLASEIDIERAGGAYIPYSFYCMGSSACVLWRRSRNRAGKMRLPGRCTPMCTPHSPCYLAFRCTCTVARSCAHDPPT